MQLVIQGVPMEAAALSTGTILSYLRLSSLYTAQLSSLFWTYTCSRIVNLSQNVNFPGLCTFLWGVLLVATYLHISNGLTLASIDIVAPQMITVSFQMAARMVVSVVEGETRHLSQLRSL
jgi:hypothetical protein